MSDRRPVFVVALLIGVGILAIYSVAKLIAGGPPLALKPSGQFSVNGEYASDNVASVRGPRYGSWSGNDKNTGELTSAPFDAPAVLALEIAGYPSHPGERVELVRVDNPAIRVRLDVGPDPQEHWQKRFATVPQSWRGVPVTFAAVDAGGGFGDWLGIADVHAASAPEIASARIASALADVRIRLLSWSVAALFLVFPCLSVANGACRALRLPPLYLFAITLVMLGVGAEVTFFLTMIDSRVTDAGIVVLAVGGSILTIRDLRTGRFRDQILDPDAWRPFAATALCGLAYAALLVLGIPSTGDTTATTQAWLGLPPDNYLPHALALHIAAHAPPKPFFGDWLSSDRPPLQAGFDLLFAALVPSSLASETRYEALSLLLQATIFGVLFTLCRAIGATARRAAAILVLAWLSSFFFVNTVFVWPKLLAGTFVAVSIVLFCAGRENLMRRAALIGVSTGLGWLSHGAVIFTLPALIVAWIIHDSRAVVRPLAVAAAFMLLAVAPWTWYQRAYDPPGDRLLKWHLAGQIGITDEPFVPTLLHAYTAVPPATIVQNKIRNAITVMGINTAQMAAARLPIRGREFFLERFALGALFIPYLAALLFARSRRVVVRRASRFAWIALGANVFWCLAMYGPSTTVVHQGSYLTVALMYFAAGCIATEWLPVYALVLIAQAVLFCLAWIPMFSGSALTTLPGSCAMALLVLVAAACAALVWRPLVTATRNFASIASTREGRRSYLAANGRELATLALVALVCAILAGSSDNYLAATGIFPSTDLMANWASAATTTQ